MRDEESALEAAFVPGAGMLCCSLRHRGEELLAQNAGVAAYAQRGKTMGIPLLYPWANRLAGFDYSLAGRTVRIPYDPSRVRVDANGLPIHGVIGGRMAWELTGAPKRNASSLAARLSWSDAQPALFELFPFRHDLRYEARLRDGRLEIELSVHACGADAVPLSFGFHPYLSPPGAPRERWLVELPAMRALALDPGQIPTGSRADARGPALRARRARVRRRVRQRGRARPLRRRGRRPADRADVPAGLSVRAGVRARAPGSSSASSR